LKASLGAGGDGRRDRKSRDQASAPSAIVTRKPASRAVPAADKAAADTTAITEKLSPSTKTADVRKRSARR